MRVLPPRAMLNIAHRAAKSVIVLAALVTLLTGCAPPGARALLEGKRLLEERQYPQAIEKLRSATVLLSTNSAPHYRAQAWNYLGVACHYANQLGEADKAYRRAIAIDKDLAEAHYNLGNLLLEQNNLEAAISEFNTYSLQRNNSPDGFLKLGTAYLRAAGQHSTPRQRDLLTASESSFQQAWHLNPRTPEAPNGLGLIRLDRGKSAEAAQMFTAALKNQPDYPPALLNLAIVSDRYTRDWPLALQKYRAYLALKPRPQNFDAVQAAAHDLEQAMHPPTRPQTNATPHASTATKRG
ncbi:MAG: hypothetical protein C5B50_24035 [Verrucomicrobia bacterium]|nr:MAG: hypothetical protein C5B50_24035 [Verrucomicrobiota bacterium]